MNINRNFFIYFILVVSVPSVTTTNCELLTVGKAFLEKFLTILISDNEDPNLCDVNKFYSYEFPHCTDAMMQNGVKKNVADKIYSLWKLLNTQFRRVGLEKDYEIDFRNDCPKFREYLVHLVDAFGGKSKNKTLWTNYCKDKATECDKFDKITQSEKFLEAMFDLEEMFPNKSTLEAAAKLFSIVLLPKDADKKKLTNCLHDLFKTIENKLH